MSSSISLPPNFNQLSIQEQLRLTAARRQIKQLPPSQRGTNFSVRLREPKEELPAKRPCIKDFDPFSRKRKQPAYSVELRKPKADDPSFRSLFPIKHIKTK